MLAGMTSAQLLEWRAFFRLEHIPEAPLEAQWMQSAIVAQTVANHAFGRKGPPAKLEEFLPKFSDAAPVDPDRALYESMKELRTRPTKPSTATAPAPTTKRKAITSPKEG